MRPLAQSGHSPTAARLWPRHGSLLIAFMALMIIGLGGCDSAAEPSPTYTVRISGVDEVLVGNTIELAALVTSTGGQASQSVTWSSSDPTVATVARGVVTGFSPGSVVITAASTEDLAATASKTVTVIAPLVDVNLTGPTTVVIGQTIQLASSVTSSAGTASQAVTWSSSAPEIATVDQEGAVTGVAAGSATIRASAQDGSGAVGELFIDVVSARVTVSISGPTSIERGRSAQLSATVTSSAGGISQEVTWTSGNEAVVAVDASGLVRGISTGSADITATSVAEPGASATMSLSVTQPALSVTSIAKVSGDQQTGVVGLPLGSDLIVEVRDQFGDRMAGLAVAFAIAAGDGVLSASEATTDGNGRAATQLTLGDFRGQHSVTATVLATNPALSTTFTAIATGPFGTGSIDAISFNPDHRSGEKYFMLKGEAYTRFAHGAPSDGNFPRALTTRSSWPAGWGAGDVDATVYNSSNQKHYWFKGDEYIRFSQGQPLDPGYPRPIVGNWSGWPAGWGSGGLDAIAYHPSLQGGKYFLYKGREFARHSHGAPVDANFPRALTSLPGWPASWGDGNIDAAVYNPGVLGGKFYFFKNDEFMQFTRRVGPDVGYPTAIVGTWAGWP